MKWNETSQNRPREMEGHKNHIALDMRISQTYVGSLCACNYFVSRKCVEHPVNGYFNTFFSHHDMFFNLLRYLAFNVFFYFLRYLAFISYIFNFSSSKKSGQIELAMICVKYSGFQYLCFEKKSFSRAISRNKDSYDLASETNNILSLQLK